MDYENACHNFRSFRLHTDLIFHVKFQFSKFSRPEFLSDEIHEFPGSPLSERTLNIKQKTLKRPLVCVIGAVLKPQIVTF